MANDNIKLYNFYRRYTWNEDDFAGWQDGMVSLGRGIFEGQLGAAVLKGLGYTLNGDLDLQVTPGIACGPDGYLHVLGADYLFSIEAPSSTYRCDLVVLRPNLIEGDFITKPTDPNLLVPLTEQQSTQVVVIPGEESSTPEYPAKGDDDVVLFGIRTAAGTGSLTDANIDLEERDLPGKNSNFQQDAGKFDDRLRPYKANFRTLAIKPSQLEAPQPRVFSYVNKARPSIFPKSVSGDYNGTIGGDTFLNFMTGAISGADETSSPFTPTIPTNASIVACVSLTATDELVVSFGTQGTLTECIEGIKSQKAAGAGAIEIQANTKPIAFVVVSGDGAGDLVDILVYDCRGGAGIGEQAGTGISAAGVTTPGAFPYTMTDDDNGRVLLIDSSTGAKTVVFPAPTSGFVVTVKDKGGMASTYPITFSRDDPADTIEGLAADYVGEADYGCWTFAADGTGFYIIP